MSNKYIINEGDVLMTSFNNQNMSTESYVNSTVRFTFFSSTIESDSFQQAKADNLIVALQDYGSIGEDVEYSFSTIFMPNIDYYAEIIIE